MPQWLRGLIIVVVSAAAFLVGWYLTGLALRSDKTYANSQSGISFKYPGGWKKVANDGASAVSTFGLEGLAAMNEVMMADAGGEDTKYFLGVGSVSSGYAGTWDQLTQKIKATFDELVLQPPAGATLTQPVYSNITIAGRPAYEMKITMNQGGTAVDMQVTFVQGATHVYFMMFITNTSKGGNMQPYDKILQGLKLTG